MRLGEKAERTLLLRSVVSKAVLRTVVVMPKAVRTPKLNELVSKAILSTETPVAKAVRKLGDRVVTLSRAVLRIVAVVQVVPLPKMRMKRFSVPIVAVEAPIAVVATRAYSPRSTVEALR